MQVAQFNSHYQYDPKFERGMYLYEHRRCFNNIIGYCNSLCYHGKLQPKRGMEKGTIFPAMGYLHIDGRGMKPNGGSRYNPLEAETIAAWLVAHKDDIERHYGEPLYKVVGVVTPFSAQVNAIKTSLRKLEINGKDEQGSLTVGTVHSLQGAERAIVLFSPVYSKHEDGRFLDSNSSILNVAVSRAKDSFLVFGDMDLIEMQPAFSPRGLLAKYLFSSDNNALQFEFQKRQDLIPVLRQRFLAATVWAISRWKTVRLTALFWSPAVAWMYWKAIQRRKHGWMTAEPWQCLPVVRQQVSP